MVWQPCVSLVSTSVDDLHLVAASLLLDLQLALTRCAHCVRLVGSSRTQRPQLVTIWDLPVTWHEASRTIYTGIVLRAWGHVRRAYRAQGALCLRWGHAHRATPLYTSIAYSVP